MCHQRRRWDSNPHGLSQGPPVFKTGAVPTSAGFSWYCSRQKPRWNTVWAKQEPSLRPPGCHPGALPTELFARVLAWTPGRSTPAAPLNGLLYPATRRLLRWQAFAWENPSISPSGPRSCQIAGVPARVPQVRLERTRPVVRHMALNHVCLPVPPLRQH